MGEPSPVDVVAVKLTAESKALSTSKVVGLVLVAALVTLLIYASFFGLWQGAALGGPEAWGQFGDYVGGLLNPIVGIATVLLVVETLRVTRTEAEEGRKMLAAQASHLEAQVRDGRLQHSLDGVHS